MSEAQVRKWGGIFALSIVCGIVFLISLGAIQHGVGLPKSHGIYYQGARMFSSLLILCVTRVSAFCHSSSSGPEFFQRNKYSVISFLVRPMRLYLLPIILSISYSSWSSMTIASAGGRTLPYGSFPAGAGSNCAIDITGCIFHLSGIFSS